MLIGTAGLPLLKIRTFFPAQVVGLLHCDPISTLTSVPLANAPTQAPVLVSVRTACRAIVCAPGLTFEALPAICVPIAMGFGGLEVVNHR